MLKKIKQLSVTLAAALLLAVPMLVPVAVHADTTIEDSLCSGILVANGANNQADTPGTAKDCKDDKDSDNSGLNKIIRLVINLFSLIVGAVSIIMIIFGGFKYVTSGGSDSNVGEAKKTILYALIGLVIVALAQVIVRFVLTKAANITA